MSTGNERCKAAAWAWYQRGASGSCAQPSGALMQKRRRRKSSSHNEEYTTTARRGMIGPQQPSRFKREAAAAAHHDHSVQTTPPFAPAVDLPDQVSGTATFLLVDDHQQSDQSHPAAAGGTGNMPVLQNLIAGSPDHSPQSFAAACRSRLSPSTSPDMRQPGALPDGSAGCNCDWLSPGRSRKSTSSQPVHGHWTDKLFGISSRKSFSASESSVDSLSSVSSFDGELDSLISLSGIFSSQSNSESAAFHSLNSRSSLLDSFELCAVLKKLGYHVEPQDHDPKEQVLISSLEKETMPELENDHQDFSPPLMHCKQSLYDLLGWSERGLDRKGCICTIEEEDSSRDHYDHAESPEINISTCSSSDCSGKAGASGVRHRRRRRPSMLMPHLPHSFFNAFHHMHLPHSFSNALHHLPHSFSSALHQITHLTHSLSSAYRHRHGGSQGQNADEGVAHMHLHINETPPSTHNSESAASPSHHAHTHREGFRSSLRHILPFKWHRSPLHPSSVPAFDSLSQDANCCNNSTPTLVQHHLKSSPSFDRHLSNADGYMLIYSSAKKHSDYGTLHHHYHHHYHHHHYIL